MIRHAALYCRLSPRPDDSYEGVDLQERWGRDYSAGTWPGVPVRVYADAGISAANGDHRPAYTALREAVARGEVAHLWCVEQTRLERQEVEWFRLAAELDAAGITELHTNRDGIVRVRDEVAGIKAVLAAGEVRKLRRRVNDRLDAIAAEGRPSGARAFGYVHGLDRDGKKTLIVVEDRAAIVRESAERVLAGWSLSRIAADLNARGIRGGHGGLITGYTVRSMITNPTVAGLRQHRGRIVGRGVWEPILDEATWHAVRNKLTAARVVQRPDGRPYPISGTVRRVPGRRYLLTGGTSACGVCGAPLLATVKQIHGVERPYYLCHPTTGGRSCVGIQAEPFERHVISTLLDELDKPAFRDALAADEHAARRDEISNALQVLEGKRNALAEQWGGDDALTADEWRTARRALAEREAELRAELATVPPAVDRIDPTLLRSAWDAMNLDERREVIGMFIARVLVYRAKVRGGRQAFDPGRVAIEWRQT